MHFYDHAPRPHHGQCNVLSLQIPQTASAARFLYNYPKYITASAARFLCNFPNHISASATRFLSAIIQGL